MDKVKLYLTILKKHHFWVLCGIAAVAGVVAWWMGSQSLSAQAAAFETTVKGAYSKLTGITNPPNERWAAAVEETHGKLKSQALGVWKKQYDDQQSQLVWPQHLDKKFHETIAKLQPGEPIPDEERKRYATTIFDGAWDELHRIIDMRRPVPVKDPMPATGVALPAGQVLGPNNEVMEWVGTVEWVEQNRMELRERYWFDATAIPSDTKVRLTQEDLWALKNMALVIATTNRLVADTQGVALDQGNAAVKRIDSMDVAQWAIAMAQADGPMVSMPTGSGMADATGAQGAMPMGGMMPPDMAQSASGTPTTSSELETMEKDRLLDTRYLKDDGQPMTAAELATPPFVEFRQLFVRMKLVADQRRIPELLAVCANAPLPIEIRRMRIQIINEVGVDPSVQTAGGLGGGRLGGGMAGGLGAMGGMGRGGMGGMGPMGPGMLGGKGGMGMEGGRFGGMMPGGPGPAAPMPGMGVMGEGSVEPGPFDVTLELCGVITLYNRPDETPGVTKLGTGTATEPGKKVANIPTAPVIPPGGSAGGGMRGMGGMEGLKGDRFN